MNKQDLMILKIDLEEAITSFNKKCKLLGYEEEQIKIQGDDSSFFPAFFKDLPAERDRAVVEADESLRMKLEKMFSGEVFYTSLRVNKELTAAGFEAISDTKYKYNGSNVFAKVTNNNDGDYLITIV